MRGPKWLKEAVFYNIYPQSYYDTNGDGIGDLRGIYEKLDYIHDMGFNALWLNPFYESPFNDAGYDITDYYKVAPRYGTMDDFKELCKKAHSLGIKVCIDFVGGHTSMECEWFKESAKAEKNKYTNRYIWTDDWLKFPKATFVNGYGERNAALQTNFFYTQPALNYGHAVIDDPAWQLPVDHPDCQETKAELYRILDFWIQAGCDGYRVDLASGYVKNDPDGSANRAFWNEIRAVFDKKYPESVLIAEWGQPEMALRAGYHIDMLTHDFHPAYTKLLRADKDRDIVPSNDPNSCFEDYHGHSYFDSEGKGNFAEFLDDYSVFAKDTKEIGYISIPSGNHDLPRVSLGRTQEDLKLIFAFLLTMPGIPLIYYGDEIGMRYRADVVSKEGGYRRTGSRTPMQWTSGKNLGFSEGREEDLYLPIDKSEDAPNVEAQLADKNSLIHTVRKLIRLRKQAPVLWTDGEVEFYNHENGGYPLIYTRTYGDETYLICINVKGKPMTFDFTKTILPIEPKVYQVLMQNKDVFLEEGVLHMPEVSFMIAKKL